MALLDPARATVRLSSRELAAATLLLVDPASPSVRHPEVQEALGRLESAGLVAGDALLPPLADLLGVVQRPQLRLVVEILRPPALVTHAAWATPEVAVIGRSVDEDAVDHTDPVSLPFILAGLVGLGRRPVPSRRAPVAVTVAVLDTAAALVGRGDVAGAVRHLRDGGARRADAEALAALAARRRCSWRVSSMWMDEAGATHGGDLTVVDAGASGLWRSNAAGGAEPGPHTVLELTPLAPSEVWRALVALLPVHGGNGAVERANRARARP